MRTFSPQGIAKGSELEETGQSNRFIEIGMSFEKPGTEAPIRIRAPSKETTDLAAGQLESSLPSAAN